MPRNNDRLAPRPASGYGASTSPPYNGTSRSYSQATPADANRQGKPTKRIGKLEQAKFSPDGKPAYRLISSDGSTYVNLLPQQGVNLDPFVNRNVELEGVLEYHSEPRKTYFVTTAVNPLQ